MLKLIVTAFILFFAQISSAQIFDQVGIRFNPNYSFFHGIDTEGYEKGSGFSEHDYTSIPQWKFGAGVFFRKQLTHFWEIEYGIGYMNKGQEIYREYVGVYMGVPWPVEQEWVIDIHYLQLPVHANFMLRRERSTELLLTGGLNLNYRARVVDDFQHPFFAVLIVDHSGGYYSFELSALGAITYRVNSNIGIFDFAIQAEHGITPFCKYTDYKIVKFHSILSSSRTLNLGVGVKYAYPLNF